MLPLAIQLYTVRDRMEVDAVGTLSQLKQMGYDHLEGGDLYGYTPAEYMKILGDLGLDLISIHSGYEKITENPQEVLDLALALNVKFVVIGWIGGELSYEPEKWIRHTQELAKAGAVLRGSGVQLCYHNHHHEMVRIPDGRRIIDLMFDTASPEDLAAEVDTCWVQYGNEDPTALIMQYGSRCPLLHIKDYVPGGEHCNFKPVGHGCLDWNSIISAGRAVGSQWYIVEQDSWGDLSSLDCARLSIDFLKQF